MLNSGIYGTGIGYDTKANILVGPDGQKMAIRFKATTTAALKSVRFVQRGGAGYSRGTGGTMTLSVRADDGAGHPASSSLAWRSYSPGNPAGAWEKYDAVTFSSPPTLTAGRIYYIVFANASTSNYISVNSVYAYRATSPRQPMFSDSEYGLMYTSGSWGALERGYTPVVDLAYTNGRHDGQSYYEAMIDRYVTISGASRMARERFTVSGGSRTVGSASVRVRRSGGTSPLVMTLQTSAGAAIESVKVPAASVPVSAPGGDNGGAVWVKASFITPRLLSNGSTYNLRLSTASGTTYTTFPVRAGTDKGLGTFAFSGGTGQSTTNGSAWSDIYLWSHQDLQFYFTLVPAVAVSPIQLGRIQYNSPGVETTSSASLNGEYVVIQNRGTSTRSLTGWTVRDAHGHVYTFGAFSLGARKSVVLRTGKGVNTAGTRYWGSAFHLWGNTRDKAALRAPARTANTDYCAWSTGGPGYKIC